MKLDSRSRQGLVLIAGCLMFVPLLVGQGCPGTGTGRPLPGEDLKPAVTVLAPSVNRTSVIGDVVTVLYDAIDPTNNPTGALAVSAFYDRDGQPGTGDEVVFAQSLPSGTSRFTQLNTSGLSPGVLYVGITAENANGKTTGYAPGRITLVATANLTFLYPSSNIMVGPGVNVPIAFNAGTGVTNFTWSLFYDTDGVFNNDEIAIATGSNTTSPVVESGWDVPINQAPGVYYLGARVVTSDGGENTTYSDGTVTVTSGPYVQILLPEAGTAWPSVRRCLSSLPQAIPRVGTP